MEGYDDEKHALLKTLPRFCAGKLPDLFKGEPEAERPRRHSHPAGNKSFVEAEKTLVTDGHL